MTVVQSLDIPPPPDGSTFTLGEIKELVLPHPFMITKKHVVFASDHRSGMLTEEAIESSGAPCGWEGRCRLSLKQHEKQMTLFIYVPQNRDLNAIPGLLAYLNTIKEAAQAKGIDGFAFPVAAICDDCKLPIDGQACHEGCVNGR